ncbi:thiopurine S-methyltransferase [Hoeflea sp.]|uniref:thiopurine S-methyltransferase n=1 Tax=Hoeflea sp. TaxID=1940281 RepID=UPI003BAE7406
MDHDFWHERWESGRIGFHAGRPNPLLVDHFPKLNVPADGRVFLPLCGKTLDIDWLLERGYRVAGAELSEIAVREVFERLGVAPEIEQTRDLKRYSGPSVEVFAGDIFALTPDLLGSVTAVFDRAALVALPERMRGRYTAHLASLSRAAPQLLVCFEYDRDTLEGPPFSISATEVAAHYAGDYEISQLDRHMLEGGMKGVPATETVWLLEPR